jgi:hypothetical protein
VTKFDRYAPVAVGVLIALPTLLSRYLPMSDLPLHEGVIGLLRHFGDPAYMPEGLYRLNLWHPNQLFHLSAAALSFVVSTSAACRIIVAAAQILMFVGGARLADYLGRSRAGVVLLAPLALGFTYYWGLVANLIGFASFLWALPLIDRAAREPSWRNAAKASAMFVLLFFAHETVFFFAALVVGVFTVLRPLSWRETPLRVFPAFFAFCIALAHLLWEDKFFTKGQMQAPLGFFTPWARVRFFPNAVFGSYDLVEQLLLLGMSFLGIGLLIQARIREPKDVLGADSKEQPLPAGGLRRYRALLDRYRFELIAGLHFIGYAICPFNWRGATLLHERFLGPAWALLVIVVAPRVTVPRLARLVPLVVPVGILLLCWPQFADADRTYRDLDAIIERIPKNVAVTLASLDRPAYHTRTYSAGTGPARIVAERGGRIGISLMISPISAVQLLPEWRWDEYDLRTTYKGSKMLLPAHDLQYFEYVVGQSRDPDTRKQIKIALSPEADFVVEKGEWLLFHSRLKVLPLKSKEVPPAPSTQTIMDRVYQVAKMQAVDEALQQHAAEGQK